MESSSTEISRRHSSAKGFTRCALGLSAVLGALVIKIPFSPWKMSAGSGEVELRHTILTILPEEACESTTGWPGAHDEEVCLDFVSHDRDVLSQICYVGLICWFRLPIWSVACLGGREEISREY